MTVLQWVRKLCSQSWKSPAPQAGHSDWPLHIPTPLQSRPVWVWQHAEKGTGKGLEPADMLLWVSPRKNVRALVLLPLGNSFLFVHKTVLNGDAAVKGQRKELTGFLQASQEQHMWEQSCSPYRPPSEQHHLFIQCLVRRSRVLPIHQFLWNSHNTMDFSYNTLF